MVTSGNNQLVFSRKLRHCTLKSKELRNWRSEKWAWESKSMFRDIGLTEKQSVRTQAALPGSGFTQYTLVFEFSIYLRGTHLLGPWIEECPLLKGRCKFMVLLHKEEVNSS